MFEKLFQLIQVPETWLQCLQSKHPLQPIHMSSAALRNKRVSTPSNAATQLLVMPIAAAPAATIAVQLHRQ